MVSLQRASPPQRTPPARLLRRDVSSRALEYPNPARQDQLHSLRTHHHFEKPRGTRPCRPRVSKFTPLISLFLDSSFLIGLTATPSKPTLGFFDQNLVTEYPHTQDVPFNQRGGLAKARKLFGSELKEIIADLNQTLVG